MPYKAPPNIGWRRENAHKQGCSRRCYAAPAARLNPVRWAASANVINHMDIVLACTGYPQRELARLQMLIPQLAEVYSAIVFSVPSNLAQDEINELKMMPKSLVVVNSEWSSGRHSAIQKALETSGTHIHYADLDRVLRWIENRPAEWRQVVSLIPTTDCLIIGRTEAAFQTHPQALQQTERIINAIFSYSLGQAVDLGGGSRGFSRSAAQFLMTNSVRTRAWCVDSEWVMLLHQAGFEVKHIAVNGLESTRVLHDIRYRSGAVGVPSEGCTGHYPVRSGCNTESLVKIRQGQAAPHCSSPTRLSPQ